MKKIIALFLLLLAPCIHAGQVFSAPSSSQQQQCSQCPKKSSCCAVVCDVCNKHVCPACEVKIIKQQEKLVHRTVSQLYYVESYCAHCNATTRLYGTDENSYRRKLLKGYAKYNGFIESH